MLWIEKYRPKSFSEISSHPEIVETLQSYTLETLPNLIFHGQPGHNKRTMLYSLISHLYGKYPEPKRKNIEIEAGSTNLTVSYLESEEMIEISLSEYGYKDRFIVQSIIKEMAQNKPIVSLFGSKKRSVKILVLDQSEDLSKDAQAALRRTIEVYSSHFRIVLLCSETSKIIDPIKSRCLMVRMRGFTDEEIKRVANQVLKKENFTVPDNTLHEICNNSNGDCKRALCLLELCCFNTESEHSKKPKTDYSNFKLEWELRIDNVISLIKTKPRPETMIEIRKELYTLLGSNIPPNIIILYMLKGISSKASLNVSKILSEFAIGYEERVRLGSKPIYHIEAFAASCMLALSQKK